MTDSQAAAEKLRAAFQALGESAEGECSAADVERIWRAVAGELPAEERRELVDRMATNPACAEAWRVANELWVASGQQAGAGVGRPARFSLPSWLAAAAVVLVGVGIVISQVNRDSGDTFRDANRVVVASLVPPDMMLPRDAFRLRWTPGPEGSRYDVRVTTEDLRVLESVSGIATPELVIEEAALSGVGSGSRVLWQVDASLPSGERVSSQTFVVRVQ